MVGWVVVQPAFLRRATRPLSVSPEASNSEMIFRHMTANYTQPYASVNTAVYATKRCENTLMNTVNYCDNPPTPWAAMICKLMKDNRIGSATEFARETGMKQPTIQRILSGKMTSPPSKKTVKPILSRFGITYAQFMREEYYVPRPNNLSAAAERLARKWESLPPNLQKCVTTLLNLMTEETSGTNSKKDKHHA